MVEDVKDIKILIQQYSTIDYTIEHKVNKDKYE